jgi:hypothetical protein
MSGTNTCRILVRKCERKVKRRRPRFTGKTVLKFIFKNRGLECTGNFFNSSAVISLSGRTL